LGKGEGMDTEKVLLQLCEPILSEAGYELVDLEVIGASGRRTARFFIDKPGGVGLEDCARVSRMIDPVIDEKRVFRVRYIIEVSSPGLERPLRKLSDYERFSGRKIRLKLQRPVEGRRRYTGLLLETRNQQSVVLEIENGSEAEIPLEAIARANLVFEWK
jgi:ribosome maturation factor RimP